MGVQVLKPIGLCTFIVGHRTTTILFILIICYYIGLLITVHGDYYSYLLYVKSSIALHSEARAMPSDKGTLSLTT